MNNFMSLKGKRQEYYKYKKSVWSDVSEKDISVNDDQWPTGTTAIVGDSILNHTVEEKFVVKGI